MGKIKKRQKNKHQINPALQGSTFIELSQLSDTVLDFDDNKDCEAQKSCPLVIS